VRLVFIGSSKFGLRCLEKSIHLPEIDVVGIITNPENFSISYRPSGVRNVLHSDFHPIAEQYGIPLWNMVGKMTDSTLVNQVRAWAPELILVVGWYHKIPKVIREIAPTAGLHASLLPNYSGGAPLVWAIINGEKKTGISFFLMDEGIDSGAIIGQIEEPIYFEDTIATLYARIEEDGLQLIEEYLPKIARGEVSYTPQDESKRRLMPQRSPEDGEIDWSWSALRIYNFIRAQTRPYPGAFTYVGKEKVTIWKGNLCATTSKNSNIPGQIVVAVADTPEAFGICCGDTQMLLVSEVGLSDGKVMSGAKFIQMRKISTGSVLG